MQSEWLKATAEPEPEDAALLIDTVAVAWQGLPEPERLASGLYPALIRALAAAGDGAALAGLVAPLAAQAEQDEAGPALAALLRQLRQQQRWPTLRALLDALQPHWRPGRAWAAPLSAAVLVLAREADEFDALRCAAAWLPPLLDAAEADPAADAHAWRDLGRLAQRTLQVPAMQRVATALLRLDGHGDEAAEPVLVQLLALLSQFAPDAATRALLDAAAERLPRHPAVQLGRARIAHAEGADLAALCALVEPCDRNLPGWAGAIGWLAGTLFHGGDDTHALALYEQLAEAHALAPADRLRWSHLRAREDTDTTLPDDADEADAPPPAVAGTAADGAWSPDEPGPFGPALAPLAALLKQPPTHGSPHSAERLAEAGAAAGAHFAATLPTLPGLSMQACLQLGRQLAQLEAAAFASHTQWLGAFPFALGPAYGSVDAQRCRALGRSLHAHVVALAGFALDRPHALAHAPAQASLRQALDLAELRCEARWALGETDAALAELQALQDRLGAMGQAPLAELQARAHLTHGTLDAVGPLLAPEGEAPAEVLPLADWADWLAGEGLHPQTLVDDGPLAGTFESVGPDGTLRQHGHRLAPTLFSLAHHTDLRVRDSHLLLGPRSGILRPGPWHLSMGDYPYEHRHVRLRGGPGAAGAVLRAARWQRVDTPVIVLANMDATYHRNYYHWMLLILTRIEALRARGLLVGGRKLLLPRELSGWMRASLAAIGIGDEQVLPYDADADLRLGDAVVASPLDFASPSLVEGLRQTLWRHAGLDPAQPPEATRLLYISRRGEGRRPLVEEARIQRSAEAMGFEAVAPETLTLAEQVRLFASARGIAGPPGAAYTNLVWAGPGTRVLSIFKEEANLPTFIDLSILRGQAHRWLLGRNLPGYELMSVVNAPFSVNPTLAEQSLQWVVGHG
ncbi:MAG: glycosyltransferase family 61 protein [Burkholderiaceae bacterium]